MKNNQIDNSGREKKQDMVETNSSLEFSQHSHAGESLVLLDPCLSNLLVLSFRVNSTPP